MDIHRKLRICSIRGELSVYYLFVFQHILLLGLYLLIGFVCLCASVFQNGTLINNYFKYETVRKIDEIELEGPMYTPEIIICGDPPNLNINQSLILGHPVLANTENSTIIKTKIINTMFKVFSFPI